MKQLITFLLISSGFLFAQTTVMNASIRNATKGGAVNLNHSILANFGGSGQGMLDGGGDNDTPIATPFILPAANPTFDGKCHIYVHIVASMTWGCALFADNGGTPVGGAFVCGVIQTSTPTDAVFNTVQMAGCPATLTGSAGTVYWVVFYTHDTLVNLGITSINTHCPGTNFASVWSSGNNYTGGWPGTFPTLGSNPPTTSGYGCGSVYVQLGYTSSVPYDVISLNEGGFDVNVTSVTNNMATTTAGHGFLGISEGDGTVGVVTAVVTTTNGTTTDTLTKIGCSTNAAPKEWCFWWVDRVTAGVNGLKCTFTNSGGSYKAGCDGMEINGTIASGSVDKHANDSVYIASQAFTAANSTATTTQAQEFWVGFDFDGFNQAQPNSEVLSANGGGWTLLLTGESAGNSPSLHGFFSQTKNSTGVCTLQGTANSGAASNNHLAGCITLK